MTHRIDAARAAFFGCFSFAMMVAPAEAQRASCNAISSLISSELAYERVARDEQREFIQAVAMQYQGDAQYWFRGADARLNPRAAQRLASINARVQRHSGNVRRLNGQYRSMGCAVASYAPPRGPSGPVYGYGGWAPSPPRYAARPGYGYGGRGPVYGGGYPAYGRGYGYGGGGYRAGGRAPHASGGMIRDPAPVYRGWGPGRGP